jgi:hypothetical protein
MKIENQYNVHFLSLITTCLLFLLIGNSCKEVEVLDRPTTTITLLDTTYISSSVEAPTPKIVLLEEFTGVRCINCAPGHTEAANIKASSGGKVIAIAEHSNFLDDPYPFSYKNLNSGDAEAIATFIGPVGSKPTASIDRKLFAGESSKILDKTKWASKSNDEMLLSSPVNLHLLSTFNSADTSSTFLFTAHFTSAVTDPLKYTIMLVETDIVTAQLLPTNEVDSNYIHKDVLRDVVNTTEGDALGTATITPGRVFSKQFKIHIDPDWNADKLSIIVFIHKGGSSYEVVQAAEIPFK